MVGLSGVGVIHLFQNYHFQSDAFEQEFVGVAYFALALEGLKIFVTKQFVRYVFLVYQLLCPMKDQSPRILVDHGMAHFLLLTNFFCGFV